MGGPDIDLESREGSVFLASNAGFHPSSIARNSQGVTIAHACAREEVVASSAGGTLG
jgi:hypothetical protein